MTKPRTARLAAFLREALSARFKTISRITEYETKDRPIIWLGRLPIDTTRCRSAFATPLESGHWLSLKRSSEPELSPIPPLCRDWLEPGKIDDEQPPQLRPRIEQRQADGALLTIELLNQPSVSSEWKTWLEENWTAWAKLHRAWRAHRDVYERLFRLRKDLTGKEDTVEILLGVGLLRWAPPNHPPISRHLLTFQGEIFFDQNSAEIGVGPSADGFRPNFELDMLPDGVRASVRRHIPDLETTLRDSVDGPTHLSAIKLALERVAHETATSLSYVESVVDALSDGVYLAPALFVRPRGSRALQQLLTHIEEQPTDKASPLWRLLAEEQAPSEPSTESPSAVGTRTGRLYFPLPTNPEQQRILHHVSRSIGTVVQGPPGTGKSHTIANLISHLLATGERILVTAHTSQALKVLKSKLPVELQALCVSLVGAGADSNKDLEKSIHGILRRIDSDHAVDLQQRADEAEAKADRYLAELATADRELLESREAEIRSVEPVPGYAGTRTALLERLSRESAERGWLPGFVEHAAEPPLTDEAARSFFAFHAELTPARRIEASSRPVDLGMAPTEIVAIVERAAALKAQANGESCAPPVDHEALLALVRAIRSWWEDGRHAGPWASQLLADVVQGQAASWTTTAQQSARLLKALSTPRAATAPLVDFADDRDQGQVTADLRELHAHYVNGGRSGLWLFKPEVVRRCSYVLRCVRLDGVPISRRDALPLAIEALEVERTAKTLKAAWARRDVAIPPSTTPQEAVTIATRIQTLVERALGLETALLELSPESKAALGTASTPAALESVRTTIERGVARSKFQETWLRLSSLIDIVKQAQSIRPVHSSYEALSRELEALRSQEARIALEAIERFRAEHVALCVYEEICERIRTAAPTFAANLLETEGSTARPVEVDFSLVWRHAQIRTWMEHASTQQAEDRAQTIRKQYEAAIAKAAANRAWKHALERLDENAQQRLQAWRFAMARIPKTPSAQSYAPRRAEAQRHLAACLPSVPAWVVPLGRLYETVSPYACQFDTVIVDEASQCGLDALVLFHLAKRIIIVGDDKQISPQAVGVESNTIQNLQATYLQDFTFGRLFDLETSLFDRAVLCFPTQRVALREHFRCVPRIIEFSNRLCYEDNPLIPLRLPARSGIEPLRSVFVPSGYREGDLNKPEAQALVDMIVSCHGRPEYEDLTFGVICLQGNDQAREIERLLVERLGPTIFEERDLRCGDPYAFQGDERQVVFLSMVTAQNQATVALTGPRFERSFNVAMSRAQDQVWLFHSVKTDDLSPQCLRRRLLNYFQVKVPAPEGIEWNDLRRIAASPARQRREAPPPFDSWFEIDVALDLVDRGYVVTPQVQAAGYHIDLVVEGHQSRLAVECDGDTWHGPERFADDTHRQRRLERAGWRFWRLPSSHYYASRAAMIERVIAECEEMGIEPVSQSIEYESVTIRTQDGKSEQQTTEMVAANVAIDHGADADVTMDVDVYDESPAQPGALPFESVNGHLTGPFVAYTADLNFPEPLFPSADVRKALMQIVESDGPLPKSAVYRLYVEGCPHVQRAAKTVRETLNKALAMLQRDGSIAILDEGGRREPSEQVVLLAGSPVVVIRERGARTFDDVPLSEIAERIRQTLRSGKGANAEDVQRIVLREMGFGRLTPSVRQRMSYAAKVSARQQPTEAAD